MKRILIALAMLCGSLHAATVAQMLKDGIPVSASAITPVAGVIWKSDGTAFVTTATPTTADATSDVILAPSAITQTPLMIQAAAGQTAYITKWQNSAGTVVSSVSDLGRIKVGEESTSTGELGFATSASADLITLRAGVTAGAANYTLPTSVPASDGQVLVSTMVGETTWQTPGGDITGLYSNLLVVAPGTGGASTRIPGDIPPGGTAAAIASGTNDIAIGNGAVASGGNTVVVGGFGRAEGAGTTSVGYEAGKVSTGANNVYVGLSTAASATTADSNVVLGGNAGNGTVGVALTTGPQNVLVGYESNLRFDGSVSNAVAIGRRAVVGQESVAIGALSGDSVGGASGYISIGYTSFTTATGQCVFGGPSAIISDVYFGTGPYGAGATDVNVHASDGAGAGDLGWNLTINGGKGGSAADAGGNVRVKTAAAGTGTTLSDRLVINSDGNIGISTSTWGSSASAGVIAVANAGGVPTTSPADSFQFYSADISSSAKPHLRAENGDIIIIGVNQFQAIRTETGGTNPYIVLSTDYCILADTTGGAFTVRLPAAASNARRIYVVKLINSTNTLTIDTAGGNIDGAASITLTTQNASRTFQSNGTDWWIQ